MSASPSYASTPNIGQARTSTANTNRDGTGALSTIFTPGANGAMIERLQAKATGTTTAGMVRFYLHDGVNFRLWKEIVVSAITPTASVKTWEGESVYDPPYFLPPGWTIRGGPHNAEQFDLLVYGGDL